MKIRTFDNLVLYKLILLQLLSIFIITRSIAMQAGSRKESVFMTMYKEVFIEGNSNPVPKNSAQCYKRSNSR